MVLGVSPKFDGPNLFNKYFVKYVRVQFYLTRILFIRKESSILYIVVIRENTDQNKIQTPILCHILRNEVVF